MFAVAAPVNGYDLGEPVPDPKAAADDRRSCNRVLTYELPLIYIDKWQL
jgi:hypothetical protein